MDILKAAAALYRQGHAVHWLYPRSKRPVGMGWTKSKVRKKWKDSRTSKGTEVEGLESEYAAIKKREGAEPNVGIRLGSPSVWDVGGEKLFLAVIDCDVKSVEPRHRAEMEAALERVWPGLMTAGGPRVGTGRGNGSAHFYALTLGKPANPRRLAQSSEKVKVKMPGQKASAVEIKALTPDEIKAGWRLRAAWEVSLMGEGRQVVAPGSIHPDSGRRYRQEVPWTDQTLQNLNLRVPQAVLGEGEPAPEGEVTVIGKFEPVDLKTIDMRKVDPGVMRMLEDGENCPDDRSAGLYFAAQALIRASLTDDEIKSLVFASTFARQVCLEHNSGNLDKAIAWFHRNTLVRARRTAAIAADFDVIESEYVEEKISDDEAKAQQKEGIGERPWEELLTRNKDTSIKNTLLNTTRILQGVFGKTLFKHNLFTGEEVYGLVSPWGGKVNEGITNAHTAQIQHWLSTKHGFEPGIDKINHAVTVIAHENEFHPVRDYLKSLVWDGVERIDSWLVDYFGATGDAEYLKAVGRKLLVAMVARAFAPGIKFDYVVILEGATGIGKSTALCNLASEEWFSDTTINVNDKDGVLNINGVWLTEMGELSALTKADVDQLKEFISRTADRIRRPFMPRVEKLPRQGVFIGTTNRDEYLKDITGNRRFWPVNVTRADFENVKRDRDQLFAEANFYWGLDEKLYLDNAAVAKIAVSVQAEKMVSDVWDDLLGRFLERKKLDGAETVTEVGETFPFDAFTLENLFAQFGPLAGTKPGWHEQRRASDALRRLGYETKMLKIKGQLFRRWLKKR